MCGESERRLEFDPTLPALNETEVGHYCFGCGSLNPQGLLLRFRPCTEGVWAEITLGQLHEGYLGMAHGGILATILDEAMSWAITAGGDFGVTGRMSMSFRKPARIGDPLRVIGRVTSRRSRMIETSATVVCIESGEVIAEADARFVRVSEQQAAEWREAYGVTNG